MRSVSTLLLVLCAFLITSTSSSAEAQEGRPLYVAAGLGPSIGLGGGGAAFKLEESIGYHVLSPGNHPGLFVGGALGESFASGAFTFQLGGRVGFDARAFGNQKVTFLVTPMVTLGASVTSVDVGDGNGGRQASGAFNLGFAAEARLVVANERVTVWARPFGIDLHIRDGVGSRYDLLFGASYNF
jgi:hypothetical protein